MKFAGPPGARRAGGLWHREAHTESVDCSFSPPLRSYSYADVRVMEADMKYEWGGNFGCRCQLLEFAFVRFFSL